MDEMGARSRCSPARPRCRRDRAARLRAERLRNRPGRARREPARRRPGRMAPLHDRLAEVRAPTLVIAGALDPAGCARAEPGRRRRSPARGSRSSPAPATPPTSRRPRAFRSLALAFLEEEPAA